MAIWKARDYGLSLSTKSGRKLSVGYQNEMGYYYIDRSDPEPGEPFSDTFGRLMGASYKPDGLDSDWSLLFDGSSVEFFADGGRVAMTALCYPEEEFAFLEIFAEAGTVTLTEASIVEFKNN
jgi:fructan beta-fructosidase